MLSSIHNFIFPNNCIGCNMLISPKQNLCEKCTASLPFTYWGLKEQNPMYHKINHYVSIQSATGILFFQPYSITQKLLHAIKYRNLPDLAIPMVDYFLIKYQNQFQTIDMVTPIPLHIKKLRKRGYNQNHKWGKYLAQKLTIPFFPTILKRNIHQKSQTLKNHKKRFESLSNTYSIKTQLSDTKHILLIDDICTTGATLIYCSKLLQKAGHNVSILTLAYTH